jgi:hypothetical protein
VPEVGTNIFLIAPTALLAFAAAKGITFGTWNIHQRSVPMEAAKKKAIKAPTKVIWISDPISPASLLKIGPDYSDSK